VTKRGPQHAPTREEWIARLDAIEAAAAAHAEALDSMRQEFAALCTLITTWTNRQPIYVEMRPRHTRVADGGEGGQREAKAIRAARTDS
jgi:hypothetical protein